MNNEDKILQILEKIDSRLDNLETSQNEHTQLLNALISRTDIHEAEIKKISSSIDKILNTMATKDDVEELSKSIKTVENKVDILTGDLNTVEHITAKNYADIVRLKAK